MSEKAEKNIKSRMDRGKAEEVATLTLTPFCNNFLILHDFEN
jgi:hypothetical protein